MKILIIGGNRFMGLRLSLALDAQPDIDLHILNRSGQVAHAKNATVHKGRREDLGHGLAVGTDWDAVVDFACFTGAEARAACKAFGKVGRYIFVSTASVYNMGLDLTEQNFDAANCLIQERPDAKQMEDPYQYGKQQAEAIFAQQAPFPVAAVRFSFITGEDDYTRRMIFHAEHVQEQQPLYLPNPKAKISLVNSADASKFLQWSLNQSFTGPVNFASPQPVALEELLAMMERRAGQKALLAQSESEANLSPYGVDRDFTLNVDKVKSLGYMPEDLSAWLPQLLRTLVPEKFSALH